MVFILNNGITCYFDYFDFTAILSSLKNILMHPKFKAMLEVQMIGVLSFVGKFNKKKKEKKQSTVYNYIV